MFLIVYLTKTLGIYDEVATELSHQLGVRRALTLPSLNFYSLYLARHQTKGQDHFSFVVSERMYRNFFVGTERIVHYRLGFRIMVWFSYICMIQFI